MTMRILITTLLVGTALAGAPSTTTASNPVANADPETAALLQAEADACKAFEDGNADALRQALTADFTLVDSRGNVTNLEQNSPKSPRASRTTTSSATTASACGCRARIRR